MAREVDQLLRVVFQERRQAGRLVLEATELAMRSALHQAGAAALTQLLRFPAPGTIGLWRQELPRRFTARAGIRAVR